MADENEEEKDGEGGASGFEVIEKALKSSGGQKEESKDEGGKDKKLDADKVAEKVTEKQRQAHANDGVDPNAPPLPREDPSEAEAEETKQLVLAHKNETARLRRKRALKEEELRAIQDWLASRNLKSTIDKKFKTNPAVVVKLEGAGEVRIDKTGLYADDPPHEKEIELMLHYVAEFWGGRCELNPGLLDNSKYRIWCAAQMRQPKIEFTNMAAETQARYRRMLDQEQARAASAKAGAAPIGPGPNGAAPAGGSGDSAPPGPNGGGTPTAGGGGLGGAIAAGALAGAAAGLAGGKQTDPQPPTPPMPTSVVESPIPPAAQAGATPYRLNNAAYRMDRHQDHYDPDFHHALPARFYDSDMGRMGPILEEFGGKAAGAGDGDNDGAALESHLDGIVAGRARRQSDLPARVLHHETAIDNLCFGLNEAMRLADPGARDRAIAAVGRTYLAAQDHFAAGAGAQPDPMPPHIRYSLPVAAERAPRIVARIGDTVQAYNRATRHYDGLNAALAATLAAIPSDADPATAAAVTGQAVRALRDAHGRYLNGKLGAPKKPAAKKPKAAMLAGTPPAHGENRDHERETKPDGLQPRREETPEAGKRRAMDEEARLQRLRDEPVRKNGLANGHARGNGLSLDR